RLRIAIAQHQNQDRDEDAERREERDLLLPVRLQVPAKPAHTLPNARRRNLLRLRDPFELLAFALAEHPVERRLVLFTGREMLLRPTEKILLCMRRGLARDVRDLEGLAPCAAVVVDDLVLRDAEDPTPERLRIRGGVRRANRVRERRLDDVLDLAL